MCGIAGIISGNQSLICKDNLRIMTDAIGHRGPDGEGQWVNESKNVGLGHRRLSILDLSEAGNQPMHYMGRYSIVFNGEIYNFLELKELLRQKGYEFYSESDTEVIMALYDYKREDCLQDLDGMFSFVLYDNKERTVFCARDRFGEKPFYYYQCGDSFYFASEMKALWAVGVPKETNKRMLFNYWFFNYINNPNDLSETFYENIYSLKPSYYLLLNLEGKIIRNTKYWDIDYRNQNQSVDLKTAKTQFLDLFYKSIQRRLRSDVPVGTSLSGGLDSSSIVCVIDRLKNDTVIQKTFSARFPNFIKDESLYIDKVLQSVNAQGISCYPNQESMLQNLDNIIYHQEEPFGSLSIAAQYEVMQLARKNGVIVMLDGQGADEYLCGYHGLIDSYFLELKRTHKNLYYQQLGKYKQIHSANSINNISRRLRNATIKELLTDQQIDKLLGLKISLNKILKKELKQDLWAQYKKEQFRKKYTASTLNEMLYYATFCGGLQELLRYADRNSMAHSLEVRLPFLFHELVEFVFTLPAVFKVNNGFSKYLLREVMAELAPKEVVWRVDKIGYEPPNKNEVAGVPLKSFLINKMNID